MIPNYLLILLDTLHYGSHDAGATIHTDDDKLNGLMKAAAAKMNLKGHKVGDSDGNVKEIYGPVDIGNDLLSKIHT